MRKSFWENYTPEINQGGSTYYLEDKSEELYSIDEFWYLKDDMWDGIGIWTLLKVLIFLLLL